MSKVLGDGLAHGMARTAISKFHLKNKTALAEIKDSCKTKLSSMYRQRIKDVKSVHDVAYIETHGDARGKAKDCHTFISVMNSALCREGEYEGQLSYSIGCYLITKRPEDCRTGVLAVFSTHALARMFQTFGVTTFKECVAALSLNIDVSHKLINLLNQHHESGDCDATILTEKGIVIFEYDEDGGCYIAKTAISYDSMSPEKSARYRDMLNKSLT